MRLICWAFGHAPARTSYGEGQQYFGIERGPVDGIGIEHTYLYGCCRHCKKRVLFGRLHISEGGSPFPKVWRDL